MSDRGTPAPSPDAPGATVTQARPGSQSPVPGGLVDDPNELRTDDFGLGGDMREQITRALTERWNPDDPGQVTLPDDTTTQQQTPSPADTAATPAPAPETSPTTDPPQGQGAEEQAGGGSAGGDAPAAGDVAQPPAPEPTTAAEDFDIREYVRDYFGTDLTREQSQELFGILSGLQRLTPEQRAWMDQQLAGGQMGQYPVTAPQQTPAQQPAVQQPAIDHDPAVDILGPRPDTDEYLAQTWDMNARAVRAQQRQMAEIQQTVQEQTRIDQERQRALAAERIAAAEQSWRDSHPILSDGEYDGLYQRAVASGQFPALLASHHNDHTAAVSALLDQHFWTDPNLRDKAIASAASGRDPLTAQPDPNNPVAQQQAQVEAGRRGLAASVAGGGGNISAPPGSTPAVPKDPEQRKAAMVAELQSQHDFTP